MTRVHGYIIDGLLEMVRSPFLLTRKERSCMLAGPDKVILTREIKVIEELSEVEPDCKCASYQPDNYPSECSIFRVH